MQKKGFTLLEILLVVLILGVMITSVSNFFKPTNRNAIYSEICINKIYGTVHNYLNKAITGKGISFLTGWNGIIIYPDSYIVEFDYPDNQIHFWYTKWESTARYEEINLSGNRAPENCKTEWYQVRLSWDITRLSIKKNLKEDLNTKGFILNGLNPYTGEVIFLLQEFERVTPQHKFSVDARTQSMHRITCTKRSPLSWCINRK